MHISVNLNAQISCVDKVAPNTLGNVQHGVFDISSKWTNGSVLTVKFLGGSTDFVHQKIQQYARLWENFANVKFNFVTSGNADIRIGFEKGGYWSYPGSHSKNIPQSDRTMNYEGFDESTPEVVLKRTILHEFGHALGLLHEHKSPLSPIQWNKPKVYALYMQTQGWSAQKVDEQVLNRYSVEMTNKEYDRYSIMHYPIDGSLTLDGYSVDWNTDISPGDRKLIGEMYPFNTKTPIISTGGTSTTTAISSTLKNVSIEHNVIRNGKQGMSIKGQYQINNGLGKKCRFAAYFYNANGVPLNDFNSLYVSVNGKVAVGEDVTPAYEASLFNSDLFLPYDELHLGNGSHNLKSVVSVFDDIGREIAQGGATYFSYRNGPILSPIHNVQIFDNTKYSLVVMPKFTIMNARANQLSVVVHFFYNNGAPVTYYDSFKRQNVNLSYMSNFVPAFENTTYNFGQYSDLFINVPLSFFPVFGNNTPYKYYTAIIKDGVQIATSSWTNFLLNR